MIKQGMPGSAILLQVGQKNMRLKRTLSNWTKQEKMCKFLRKSFFSSCVQHKNIKPNNIDDVVMLFQAPTQRHVARTDRCDHLPVTCLCQSRCWVAALPVCTTLSTSTATSSVLLTTASSSSPTRPLPTWTPKLIKESYRLLW